MNDIARNIRGSNYKYNPVNDTMFSRAAYRGNTTGKDYDFLSGISFRGGDRNPEPDENGNIPFVGVTETKRDQSPTLSFQDNITTGVNTGQNTTGPVTYDPYAAQRAAQAKQDRENRAYLDNQINRFDSYFGDADRTRQVRLNNINNEYNNSLNTANRAWQRAQEDHNAATNDRLQTRQRQLSVADDDFKKQRDAYDRYFARIGAGSSSFARYGMPTALARAANKVRNDIEDTNAKNGAVQYRNEKGLVSVEDIPEAAKLSLDVVDEGIKVLPDGGLMSEPQTTPPAENNEIPAKAEVYQNPGSPNDKNLVKITLSHPICVNGKVYPGEDELLVSAEVAEDLLRIDREYSKYEGSLVRKQDYSRKQPRPQDVRE